MKCFKVHLKLRTDLNITPCTTNRTPSKTWNKTQYGHFISPNWSTNQRDLCRYQSFLPTAMEVAAAYISIHYFLSLATKEKHENKNGSKHMCIYLETQRNAENMGTLVPKWIKLSSCKYVSTLLGILFCITVDPSYSITNVCQNWLVYVHIWDVNSDARWCNS